MLLKPNHLLQIEHGINVRSVLMMICFDMHFIFEIGQSRLLSRRELRYDFLNNSNDTIRIAKAVIPVREADGIGIIQKIIS